MAKKMNRCEEMNGLGIDFSMPIDRFAKKAKALMNKIQRGSCDGAEYGDAAARLYLRKAPSIQMLAKFDTEVRKLAADHKELKALKLPIVDITIRSYEININFYA